MEIGVGEGIRGRVEVRVRVIIRGRIQIRVWVRVRVRVRFRVRVTVQVTVTVRGWAEGPTNQLQNVMAPAISYIQFHWVRTTRCASVCCE